jgi:hypothetical protein
MGFWGIYMGLLGYLYGIVGVFIWEKVWLENNLSQCEGGGGSELDKQAVKDKDPKWRPVVCM